MKNLVIVESPAKAKTIMGFLGPDFQVMSSYGHIRDLPKSNLGIDLQSGFAPTYQVSEGKERVVRELRAAVARCEVVWLASDEDREGEAIAWHLAEVLGLDTRTTRRIVFHEITQSAIERALQAPRTIDTRLVDAQQARRVLDRIVGFEISPVLWRRIRPSLSAGRVQSVAVRLIVDREREIIAHQAQRFYRVTARFAADGAPFVAELSERLATEQDAREVVGGSLGRPFHVESIEIKPAKRSPSPPFTTSTLQQEASRKLGFSAQRTMSVAQHLYEAGMITYMRTDSVNLSQEALQDIGKAVVAEFGPEYHTPRQFRTKSKGAQEAHEAIRPTRAGQATVSGGADEARLYDLIRKRAMASQMADARLERTAVEIEGQGLPRRFYAHGEVIIFGGFLKLYIEGRDEDPPQEEQPLLPRLAAGQPLELKSMLAQERYTQKPPRYSEATLVKRLEEMGIGRPSTYAPTIATIVERGYVERDSREGALRQVWQISLQDDQIQESSITERYGGDRKKLFPSDIAMVVTDYLMAHFPRMMEYTFTASVEEQFDTIAEGKLDWREMLSDFYASFHGQVEEALSNEEHVSGDRILGIDPATGKRVLVRIGRFGPIAQIGHADDGEKPRYASLRKDQLLETITLEEALQLLTLPRHVGEFEEQEVVIGNGRFGPYVRHAGQFTSLTKEDDPYTIDLPRAIELIRQKRERDAARVLRVFSEDEQLRVLKGRWGPFLQHGTERFRIPKDTNWEELTFIEAVGLMEAQRAESGRGKGKSAGRTARTGTAKGTATKPTTRKISAKGSKAGGEAGTRARGGGTAKGAASRRKAEGEAGADAGAGKRSTPRGVGAKASTRTVEPDAK